MFFLQARIWRFQVSVMSWDVWACGICVPIHRTSTHQRDEIINLNVSSVLVGHRPRLNGGWYGFRPCVFIIQVELYWQLAVAQFLFGRESMWNQQLEFDWQVNGGDCTFLSHTHTLMSLNSTKLNISSRTSDDPSVMKLLLFFLTLSLAQGLIARR